MYCFRPLAGQSLAFTLIFVGGGGRYVIGNSRLSITGHKLDWNLQCLLFCFVRISIDTGTLVGGGGRGVAHSTELLFWNDTIAQTRQTA